MLLIECIDINKPVEQSFYLHLSECPHRDDTLQIALNKEYCILKVIKKLTRQTDIGGKETYSITSTVLLVEERL